MLTEEQKHQFETLGFLLIKELIPMDEMKIYIDAFDETMLSANNGVPWEEAPIRQQVVPFYRHNTAVYHRLLDHPSINVVLEDLIGKEYVFAVSEGIHHFGGTSWHHDSISPEDHTHLKVVFFMHSVQADTGCLSVLPGSQFLTFRERMEKYGKSMLARGKNVPGAYPIEADAGDAVIFNVKLYHAAFGDGIERKALYLNYMQKATTHEEEEYIIHHYERDRRDRLWYTPDIFVDAPPERTRMLSFLKERCYDPVQSI